MHHVELPIGAFVSALLVLIPLPWHWRARNVPTLSIIAWLFISNVIFGVNSVVWAGNVRIVAPVWCDIVTKFQIGSTMSLPACCLCLCIHLERIASVRYVQTTHGQKRRRMLFDLALCWGLPLIYMALHYIVQGHRYDIVEDFGCRPAVYTSVQSILILWALPLLVVFLTMILASISLVHFFRRRLAFARHLRDSNSALTTSRYFRLMAMAIVQMFWGLVVMSIHVWFTCRNGLRPWTGWTDVHSNFSRVGVFPSRLIPPDILRWTHFTWWTVPISSIFFFAFFSFGDDAVKEYKACFQWITPLFRRKNETILPMSSLPRTTSPKEFASARLKHDNDDKHDTALRIHLKTEVSQFHSESVSTLRTVCSDGSFPSDNSPTTLAFSAYVPVTLPKAS
uniref:Mating-type protein ste3.3 n=1 Tax=Hypsizygus marmoreus TaxID=39966 RepID=A0A7T7DKL0_HYPMA|nr:mating-type protein ste3.3 [Hypsizygus marmoreus]